MVEDERAMIVKTAPDARCLLPCHPFRELQTLLNGAFAHVRLMTRPILPMVLCHDYPVTFSQTMIPISRIKGSPLCLSWAQAR